MKSPTRARILHRVATALILLFCLQLGLAVVSEFAPPFMRYGHALYPIFVGRDPISLPNILINCGLLVVALAAFFFADALEGKKFREENVEPYRRKREGSVRFY